MKVILITSVAILLIIIEVNTNDDNIIIEVNTNDATT